MKVALLVDKSGSMGCRRLAAVDYVNKQLAALKGQEVKTFLFNHRVEELGSIRELKVALGGARKLIGLGKSDARVHPGNYDIYVQSTSVNRKLVRGTKLLYVD